jgi:hypothetical protein
MGEGRGGGGVSRQTQATMEGVQVCLWVVGWGGTATLITCCCSSLAVYGGGGGVLSRRRGEKVH